MANRKINIFYLFSLLSTLALIAYMSVFISRLNMIVGASGVKAIMLLILVLLLVSLGIQVFLILSSRREE